MWSLEKMMAILSKFQQSQEDDVLTEFAIVFLLGSIILVSTMNILLNFIDARSSTYGLF